MRLVLKSVRLFDPGMGLDASGRNVVIEDGKILDLDAPASANGDRVIYRNGLLAPGFIDLRAHLCEPGHARRETIESGLEAAAAGGFTTVVAMPTTDPTIDRVDVVELILSKAGRAARGRVLPAGALSVGRKGERLAEMGKLVAAGCVCFTDADRAIRDSQLLRYAMETARDLGVPIVTHAEDESLSLGGVMHEGLVSTRLGLAGAPGAAEVVGVARDLAIAELTGGRLHIAHVSTGASLELIREARKRGIRVTADVSPLHLALTDEAVLGYDTSAKVVPPLRTRADVDALIVGLADGTIDAVASDHVPHTDLDKNVEFDRAAAGAIGLETTLSVLLELVAQGRLSLERAIASLTTGPARVLGRLDLGTFETGGVADFTLVDPDERWTYARTEIRSRSQNTPLVDRAFVGRAMITISGGNIIYEHGVTAGRAGNSREVPHG